MKKVILNLLMIIMMVSSVTALSLVSSGKVDFVSNDPLYNGEAFVVTGVENGGQDTLLWTINDFGQTLDEGYTMKGTGSIKSEFSSDGWVYPIQTRGTDWSAKIIGNSYQLTSSGASNWCSSLGGDFVTTTWNLFNYACVEYYPIGYFASLNTGEYNYDVKYTLTIDGKGSDTFTLTETSKSGGRLIGSKNYFQALIQTLGVDYRSDPDIDDKIWLYYDLARGQWKTITPDFSTNLVSYNSLNSFYDNCLPSVSFGDYSQRCINDWNVLRTNYLNNAYKSQPYIDVSGATINSQGLGTGSIGYDDGNIYRNPIVTLTINADNLQVERLFGIGEIVSVNYPTNMIVGETYNFAVTMKNVGQAQMDATLTFNCGAYSISGINQRPTINAGQTVTDSGTIKFTGGVVGCGTGDKCTLTIKNTNKVNIDDTYDFSPKVCQVSECNQQGSQDCFGNIIKECTNVNGVLKYTTIKTCINKCQDEGNNAVCLDNEQAVCGDGICEQIEQIGQAKYCPSDCKEVLPTCGDGLCDGREVLGGAYECVEGKQDPWDCPNVQAGAGGSGSNTTLIIVGIVGSLGIAGAIGLRLKKEGYF